jgi:hypothetical protein
MWQIVMPEDAVRGQVPVLVQREAGVVVGILGDFTAA